MDLHTERNRRADLSVEATITHSNGTFERSTMCTCALEIQNFKRRDEEKASRRAKNEWRQDDYVWRPRARRAGPPYVRARSVVVWFTNHASAKASAVAVAKGRTNQTDRLGTITIVRYYSMVSVKWMHRVLLLQQVAVIIVPKLLVAISSVDGFMLGGAAESSRFAFLTINRRNSRKERLFSTAVPTAQPDTGAPVLLREDDNTKAAATATDEDSLRWHPQYQPSVLMG